MNIEIKTNNTGEELLPYCSPLVYEDLEKAFNLNSLMTHNFKNNDVHIGYIKGVMDVLGRVKMLAKLNEDEE